MIRYAFTFALILCAALSRLLPHPVNVAPITALALFGGVYLDKKHTFIVPIAAMLIADYFLGFYDGIAWVYAGFILTGFVGLWLRTHRSVVATAGATLAGSVIFFLLSNFGTWLSGLVGYPRTAAGLLECYTAAIPFFRNSLAGDVAYVALLFGAYELGARLLPGLVQQRRAGETV
jgi:hypothetical protein